MWYILELFPSEKRLEWKTLSPKMLRMFAHFSLAYGEFVVGRAADDFYGEGLELAAIYSNV
jgi:hypothetical protein